MQKLVLAQLTPSSCTLLVFAELTRLQMVPFHSSIRSCSAVP
jgi:hypothetical protein